MSIDNWKSAQHKQSHYNHTASTIPKWTLYHQANVRSATWLVHFYYRYKSLLCTTIIDHCTVHIHCTWRALWHHMQALYLSNQMTPSALKASFVVSKNFHFVLSTLWLAGCRPKSRIPQGTDTTYCTIASCTYCRMQLWNRVKLPFSASTGYVVKVWMVGDCVEVPHVGSEVHHCLDRDGATSTWSRYSYSLIPIIKITRDPTN